MHNSLKRFYLNKRGFQKGADRRTLQKANGKVPCGYR